MNPTEEIEKIEREIEELEKIDVARDLYKNQYREHFKELEVKKAKLEILKLWEQDKKKLQNYYCDVIEEMSKNHKEREKEILEIIDELKTKNIIDKGLDVETQNYWINLEELKQKNTGEK